LAVNNSIRKSIVFTRSFIVAFLLSVCLCAELFAQQVFVPDKSVPNTVLVLIRPSAIPNVRDAFRDGDLRVESRRVNAQSIALEDANVIAESLDLPDAMHAVKLTPFSAQHSVAFEELRERMNPALFKAARGSATTIKSNDALADLRKAEEKLSRWFVLEYSGAIDPKLAAQWLRKSLAIELTEPKFVRQTCYQPNDRLFPQQYGPIVIHAPEAWDVVRCDSTMIVADVDDGTDWSHEDLKNSIYINNGETGLDSNGLDKRSNGVDDDGDGFVDDWHGWDFGGRFGTTPDNDSRGQDSHGTHTAGIMAATGDNNLGITGIAFGARLIPIKSGNDGGSLEFAFNGIIYAADMGAKVVNCSWGGTSRSALEQDVINYAYGKDLAVVAAAGNHSHLEYYYPASYDHVLSVSALNSSANLDLDYSNFSTRVSVCAPGTQILSTVPIDRYQTITGTSMASPHAAGALALVRTRYPKLSAGQAMQQLRATCDSIPGNPEPKLSGRGRVNLFRAVTEEQSSHSARIESVDVLDDNGDGILSPGEGAGIVLHVKNYLAPVSQLNGRIEFVLDSTLATQITSNSKVIPFGNATTLGEVENIQAAFRVRVGDSVPPNTQVLVRIVFYDSTVNYFEDLDYFTFTVNPSYRDLDRNNLTITFDGKGGIGYNDAPDNTQGSGFNWRNSPPQILPSGKNILFDAGLMVGEDTVHVVSCAPGTSSSSNDNDFTPLIPVLSATPIDRPKAVQELVMRYNDSLADPTNQVGVTVDEQSYAFTKGLAANAVVINYVLHKRKTAWGDLPKDTVSAVIFGDWDIGLSGARNKAYFNSDSTIAILSRLDPNYPYVGFSVISPIPSGAGLQFYATRNDGSDGPVTIYNGALSRYSKWIMMSQPKHSSGPADISSAFGLNNLRLRSSDSITMTIVIALATNETELAQTISATKAEYFATGGVSVQPPSSLGNISIYPNPTLGSTTASWSFPASSLPSIVSLRDVLGRLINSEVVRGSSTTVQTQNLPAGVYLLEVQQGSERLRTQIVKVQ
jgi:serine protease